MSQISIYLPPMDSFTDVGTLPTWEKVLTSLLKPPDWQFKGQSQTTTAPHCQTRPLGSCHFILSPSRCTRKCDLHWNTGWIGGLTKVTIYPACTNLHQMIEVLATSIQGPRDTGWQATQLTCMQLKQASSGHLR